MSTHDRILDSVDGSFDRLPDDIVLSIFNKLHDAKSLCSSMSVCTRFRHIAPQVDEIRLSIPQKKPNCEEESSSKKALKNLVFRTLMKWKPVRLISQMMKIKPKYDRDSCCYYVPSQVLKSFKEIRGLHLQLPGHGVKKLCKSATFLKWQAEFGSQLRSCVVLGAKSLTFKLEQDENAQETETESRLMAEDELKLRIVWTLSCLIAASARHYLIQETVKGQQRIEDVVVSDELEQGRIRMNKQQIAEMGANLECRSKMPALRMKMWYAEKLTLPGCGKVMEGATLVVIRPAGGEADGKSNVDLVTAAFGGERDEMLVEFARKLVVANKCLTLEMNAF